MARTHPRRLARWLGQVALLGATVILAACNDEDGAPGGGSGGSSAGGSVSGTGGSASGAGGSGAASVSCPQAGLPLTCASNEVCCLPSSGDNTCAATCEGLPSLACDGPDDCNGFPCCFVDHQVGTRCATGATCDAPAEPICAEVEDCPESYACCTTSAAGRVSISVCGRTTTACL